jgi:hypothetical protein
MALDEAKLIELLDRQAICDCIYRYCRGIDRADEATLRSAYWPDATDRHGIYSGPVEGFFLWAREVFRSGARNIHQVGNILIEFVGPMRAAVETYFLALQRGPGKDGVVRQFFVAGRYCGLFEKRYGEWRVARRIGGVRLGQRAVGAGRERGGAFRSAHADRGAAPRRSDLRNSDRGARSQDVGSVSRSCSGGGSAMQGNDRSSGVNMQIDDTISTDAFGLRKTPSVGPVGQHYVENSFSIGRRICLDSGCPSLIQRTGLIRHLCHKRCAK